jgi:putative tryptophan/tyrosine transport system substrate-binding protein
LRSRTVAAGKALGREILVLEIRRNFDLEPAFATLVEQGAGAVMVGDFTSLSSVRDRIIALAERHKVPTMYPNRTYSTAGGLLSYSADFAAADRQLGSQYVGRILRGASPADLPVMQPTKFELVINLKTAKALGLTIPETLLATADEVIQ